MATDTLTTKNAAVYPTTSVPHGTLLSLPLPFEAASFDQGPADVRLDNVDDLAGSAGSSSQLHQAQSISQPQFTNLPLHEETQLWDNIASLENNNAFWQHESGTVPAPDGQVPLLEQHDQHQNQISDGLTGDIQPVPTNSTWLWPPTLRNNIFLPYFESGPQVLTTRPDSILKELELGGFSTIDRYEPIYNMTLGPQYQTPGYEEFFDTMDLFQNADLPHGFDPILSRFVIDPLDGPLDQAANLPNTPADYGDETCSTAVHFQGYSNPLTAFSQTRLDDTGECVSREWMAPQLLPHGIGGATQAAKRPSSDDCLQPFKRSRNHRSATSAQMVSAMGQPASQSAKKFCQVAKRPNQDFDMPRSKSARLQRGMTSPVNSESDHLSQAFDKALAEILPPNSPRKQLPYSFPSNDTQAGSVGGFQNFQIKFSQPVAPKSKSKVTRVAAQGSEKVCLQCKVRKKQCITTSGPTKSQSACIKCLDLANQDEVLAKTLCIRPKDLDLKLVNPDVYFESYVAIAQRIPAPLSPTVQRRVAIYMTCVVDEIPHMPLLRASTALICNVDEHKVKGSDDVAIDMLNYQTFNDLRYGKADHNHSRRMPSVGIPEGQVPQLPSLIKWAISTLALVPSGAVHGLQGPLYRFASLYIEQGDRPLRRLVELAVRYTAIYNVFIGQMSLQLSLDSPVMYKVSPKLRVQICRPLIKYYTELSEQLQKAMLKALYGKHGPEKGEHLPLCIVWWLIMTVYWHNLKDAAAAAYVYYGTEEMDAIYLEDREEMLSNLSKTHQAIYHATFRRDPKSFCPIFNNALVKLCRIENNDTELHEKLQSLRTAMRQFKEDAEARRCLGKRQDRLEDLTQLFGAIDLDKHHTSPADSHNETSIDAEIEKDADDDDDDANSISSTCSLSSRISGQGRDESPVKIKARAAESLELRAYWLARCMQVHDNQSWLFGY